MNCRQTLMIALYIIFSQWIFGYDPATRNPDGVVPPIKPEHLKRIYVDTMTFRTVDVQALGQEALLSFKLACPCPPAYVHYGVETSVPPVLPLYLKGEPAKIRTPDEKGYGVDQKLTINVRKVFPEGSLEGKTVCFRIEVYVPEHGKVLFYDGRFTCHEVEGQMEILTLSRGPIVDCITATSAIISFETDCVTEGSAVIAPSLDGFRVVNSCRSDRRHEIEISGLMPDTRYYYHVVARKDNVEVESRTLSFVTAPETVSEFCFAVMTDSRASYGGGEAEYMGVNLGVVRSLFMDTYRRGACMVFFPGDLVDGYTNSTEDMVQQFKAWNQAVEPVAQFIPIYEGMGNHEMCLDTYDDGSRYGLGFDKEGEESSEFLFAKAFVNPRNGPDPDREGLPPYKENVYFVDYGQVRFLMLNTNYWICSFPEKYGGNLEGYLLPSQMNWLKEVLDEAERLPHIRHVFIAAHEPAFPTNKHVKDGLWYDGGKAVGEYSREYIVSCRDRFWEMVVSHPKVVAVINGDEHNYSRMRIASDTPVYADGRTNPQFNRPICVVVTGGAGAPLYPLEALKVPWKDSVLKAAVDYHYVMFSISPHQILLECIALNGAVLDRCVIWEASE